MTGQQTDQLIGQKISEITQSNIVNLSSYFMVSEKQQGGGYISRKISYENLINQLTGEISSLLGLSSMAYMKKEDYSEVNHDHDGKYNYVVCVPTYKPSDFEDPNKVSCICEVSSYHGDGDINVVSILYPPVYNVETQHPDIGEFRVFATQQKSKTDVQSSIDNGSFDGWVYVDGKEYQKKTEYYDFSEAYDLFNGVGNVFRVPLFGDFIRLNGAMENGDSYQKVNFHNKLSVHNHKLTLNPNDFNGKDVTVKVVLAGTSSYSQVDYNYDFFFYYYSAAREKVEITATDMTLDGLEAENSVGYSKDKDPSLQDIETKPRHDILPGMIYIGNKRT